MPYCINCDANTLFLNNKCVDCDIERCTDAIERVKEDIRKKEVSLEVLEQRIQTLENLKVTA